MWALWGDFTFLVWVDVASLYATLSGATRNYLLGILLANL
jgi:hypothetical protein